MNRDTTDDDLRWRSYARMTIKALQSRSGLAFVGLSVGLCVYLLAVFGPRPAGRDVTLVHLPRMTCYSDALHRGRVPLWNELLDFGTPVLAEGQIGVLYPPHLLLYGLFETRNAYSLSMAFHFLLAALFAYLCARGFALTKPAAALTAIVFVGQGFFVVHLTQPWSYTTGCWLPLAVLATWRWINERSFGWLLGLVMILTIQILAGHFQIAFYTHVVILTFGLAASAMLRGRRLSVLTRALALPVASLAAIAMSAAQLLPTAELTEWGGSRGLGYDYLTSFATHPLYLINYLAPTFLHQHPLWEPVAWEPWRTSPAQCLTYVGLVPIALAAWSITIAVRRSEDELPRVWCVLVLASVVLSLGPFFFGFAWLTRLPGFGWFSATARWSIVSGLFLGLLAGKGLERLGLDEIRRVSGRFAVTAVIVLVFGVTCIVFAARSAERFDKLPNRFHQANLGPQLIQYGYDVQELQSITPKSELVRMVGAELVFPILNLSAVVLLCFLKPGVLSQRQLICGAVIWSAIDLGLTTVFLHRLEFDTNLPLIESSPALSEIAKHKSFRVAGSMGHASASVGVATLGKPPLPDMSQYWTKDDRASANIWGESFSTVHGLPRWGDMGSRLGHYHFSSNFTDDDLEFMRLGNIRLLVCGPMSKQPAAGKSMRLARDVDDPWLSQRILGRGITGMFTIGSRWTMWEPEKNIETARAWAFPVTNPPAPGTDPRLARTAPPARRRMLEAARAASQVFDEGERVTVTGTSDKPSVLVLSDLNFPGWHATLRQGATSQSVPIESAFGHWRAVYIPAAGPYEITFTFRPKSFRVGRNISLGTLFVWLACIGMAVPWRKIKIYAVIWRRRLKGR